MTEIIYCSSDGVLESPLLVTCHNQQASVFRQARAVADDAPAHVTVSQ
jgi:hypothetical protein